MPKRDNEVTQDVVGFIYGESARERPVYDADSALPKLVAFLATRKAPSPEQQQLAMHLPGAAKTMLGLSVAQTLGLQKEIRSALTELRDQGRHATGGKASPEEPEAQRRRRR